MKHCINKLFGSTRVVALFGLLAALFAAGCTTKDDTLGANLIPDNQQLKAGYAVFQWDTDPVTGEKIPNLNPKKYVETRLYQTDSIVSSNLTQGYLGAAYNDTVGLRTAGFLSQFTNYYLVDEGYFGYKPIFDSAQILLSVSAYGRDTMTEQKFYVYEIESNAYLTEKPLSAGKTERDSVFYVNFDPENAATDAGKKNILGQRLFEFTLGGDNGPSKTAVTMTPTDDGKEFIKRLMLQSGERKGDYSIYDVENLSEWFKEFKGLYIRPAEAEQLKVPAQSKGSVYTLDLSASGFAVYGRNRVEEDPSLIKDTIGMVYYFYVSDLDEGNVSVNTVRHDYTGSEINLDEARAYNSDGTPNPIENRPPKSRVYVEGMGGVTTEIAFTQEFFDDLQKLIDKENAESKKDFTTLAFTQVQMEIYFPDGGRYDWSWDTDIDAVEGLIARMNVAPSRLGMYTDYGKKTNIPDYAYLYESYYDTSLAYGGYVNRSHGCYRMDITSHVQEMWNQYMKNGKKLDEVPLRRIYLGPEATDFFTTDFTELQGQPDENGSGGESQAPIRFKIAYNLIK
ncbi:MAG: DUF4270 domain-containing protein [Alistipes senegalensis]|nr:DUF4270 domain-containing protein [Bacteroides cellulosilyticus]MCM1351526.1 DUF4270 domain-containing protein [Alistipes senegalensis]